MPLDRVSTLLAAYFTRPYVEYGEVALEIRDNDGLTPNKIRLITNQILYVNAKTLIRHTNTSQETNCAKGSA